jgi:hypothetical protein
MKQKTSLHRRQFLAFALTASGALFAQASLSSWLRPQGALGAKLAGLFEHQESARIVGVEYLKKYPQEADARLLQDRIAAGFAGGYTVLAHASDSAIRQLIEDRVRQDFETEQIVKLQGWILSVTEARLCALTMV